MKFSNEVKNKLKQIYKTGNSLAVTLPKKMTDKLGLEDGSTVNVSQEGNKIIIEKVDLKDD